MVEKLKSITARIPWSLLIKASAFALLWYHAPRGVALVVAAGTYFFPVFPFGGTLAPFMVMLVLSLAVPASVIGAVIFGVCYLFILSSKELMFLARNRVHETILLLLLFLSALEFFSALFYRSSAFSFFQLAIGAIGLYVLLQGLFRREVERTNATTVHPRFAAGLVTFVLAELTIVIALVPMNLFYKTAFVLLAATVLIDLTLHYLRATRNIREMFVAFAFFFLLAVFMLVSNSWHP